MSKDWTGKNNPGFKHGITKENVSALESLVGLYDRMQAKNAEREHYSPIRGREI